MACADRRSRSEPSWIVSNGEQDIFAIRMLAQTASKGVTPAAEPQESLKTCIEDGQPAKNPLQFSTWLKQPSAGLLNA